MCLPCSHTRPSSIDSIISVLSHSPASQSEFSSLGGPRRPFPPNVAIGPSLSPAQPLPASHLPHRSTAALGKTAPSRMTAALASHALMLQQQLRCERAGAMSHTASWTDISLIRNSCLAITVPRAPRRCSSRRRAAPGPTILQNSPMTTTANSRGALPIIGCECSDSMRYCEP
ncbi:hypothetical protein FKP32DRAFT_495620 [Trametes sanguinea]|nr:hypothetical protein FKP32DRAFT_495620 [Trametes sanguinea]